MASKYSFGEIKKTATAFGGLVGTIIAYALADATIRDMLPPQWIALGGGILTVLGVFKVTNTPAPPSAESAPFDVGRAIEAVAASDDHAAEAVQQAKDLKGALASAITGVAGDVFEGIVRAAANASR